MHKFNLFTYTYAKVLVHPKYVAYEINILGHKKEKKKETNKILKIKNSKSNQSADLDSNGEYFLLLWSHIFISFYLRNHLES